MTETACCWMTVNPVFARRASATRSFAGISAVRCCLRRILCMRSCTVRNPNVANTAASRFFRNATVRNTAKAAADRSIGSRKQKAKERGGLWTLSRQKSPVLQGFSAPKVKCVGVYTFTPENEVLTVHKERMK